MQKLGVGIIGCGLIGKKRAQSLPDSVRLFGCMDKDLTRAEQLAQQYSDCVAWDGAEAMVRHPDIDIVILATPLDVTAQLIMQAVKLGKHVLVEKPAARNAAELETILELLPKTDVCVRVGFNHRYHPAILKACEMARAGELGELMFVRGRYGHGGRVGYDKEWRANPVLSGGGELIDQGVHLIDLARVILGDFVDVQGFAKTFYWDMPVDDNGFMLLKTAAQQVAFLHVSCTEWKNLFCLEIYGKNGKLQIDGLGGSYGTERLSYYKMLPEMGPPETTIWEYPGGDQSWRLEFLDFLKDIEQKRQPSASLYDAHAALTIVDTICKESGYDYCA